MDMPDDAVRKRKERGLGRGLSALIGEAERPQTAGAAAPTKLPIDKLSPNPNNPRGSFHETDLEALVQSVRDRGIMQPLLVRPLGDGRYEIVAGERRWRAAQRAGLHEVPVLIREASASEALELALIENVQRTDLNPIEEAKGYRRLMHEFGHNQEALGQLIGKSRSHVANLLRLLNLPETVRDMVEDGTLSAGHARALLGAEDPETAAKMVARMALSVRATEEFVARLDDQRDRPKRAQSVETPDTRALVRRLSDRLGLKVALSHKADDSGTLTIRYSSLEQLDTVCRRLGED